MGKKVHYLRLLAWVLSLVLCMQWCVTCCEAFSSPKSNYDDGHYVSEYAREAVAECFKYHILWGETTEDLWLFSPLDQVPRQEVFRIVYALNNGGSTEISSVYTRITEASGFADRDQIAPWAVPYAGYCIGNRLFVGDAEKMLRPEGNITYLEFAIVLLRVIGYTQNRLALLPEETTAQWKERIIRLADSVGLFENVLYYSLETYDYPIFRQDVAVMISNALRQNTITYILTQDTETHVDESRTLLSRSFGSCSNKDLLLCAATDTGYLCADGFVLPTPDGTPGDPDNLGYSARCLFRDSGEFLSWDGQAAPAQIVDLSSAAQLSITVQQGTLWLSTSDQSFSVRADDWFFLLRADGATSFASCLDLPDLFAGVPSPVRLIFDEQGALQSIRFFP